MRFPAIATLLLLLTVPALSQTTPDGAQPVGTSISDGSHVTRGSDSLQMISTSAPVEASITAHPVLFGPSVRAMAAGQISNVPVYNESPDCGVFHTGYGYRTAAGVDFQLPTLFTQSAGLSASAYLGRMAGRMTESPVDPTRIYDDETGDLVDLQRQYRLDHSEFDASFDLLARLRLTDRLGLAVGPTLALRFGAGFAQTDNITGPGDYSFADGQHAKAMLDGTPLQATSLAFGPTALLTYDIAVGDNTYLQPGLAFHADMLSTVRDHSWRRALVGLGISLLFDLNVPSPPQTPKPYLAASIKLYGMGEDRKEFALAEIQMNETRYRQVAPLLPAVFFNENQTEIPRRYDLLDRSAADTFAIDDLQGVSVYEIQHHTLDIVGARMRRYPEARLSLAGRTSGDEDSTLAVPRARRFRDYLVDTWGIDPGRIDIVDSAHWMEPSNELTSDGRADNRRVEFHSDVEAIMAPVVTETETVSYDPPYLKMVPQIDAEAGVRDWRITVTQAGATLGEYSSHQSGGIDQSDLSWKIEHDQGGNELAPIVAQLEVTDSTGATVFASDRLPLVMRHQLKVIDGRIVRTGNTEHISYTLVGFDFDKADLTWQNREAIQELAGLTRGDASVHVLGYTDRIGEVARNEALSDERAATTTRALKTALDSLGVQQVHISSKGEGVETHRFTNDTPEGRVLSRGVSIDVEQSIDEASGGESAMNLSGENTRGE